MPQPTIQDFKDRGYTEFPQNEYTSKGDCFLQRTIYAKDGGRIYFIDVYHYNLRGFESFSAEAQFVRNDGEVVFRVNLINVQSVDQVEAFFDEIWVKLQCDRYDGKERDDS